MRTNLLLLFLLLSGYTFSQEISTLRMGDIRLGMTTEELSKTLGKSIILPKEEDEFGYKRVSVVNKGISYIVSFMGVYDTDEEKIKTYVYNITTTNPKAKTLSNIGVGNNLDDLLSAYKHYTFEILTEWDDTTDTFSKTQRIFSLIDIEANTDIEFYLNNNVIYSIVLSNRGECE